MGDQAIFGWFVAGDQLNLGTLRGVVALVAIPSAVGIDLGNPEAVVVEGIPNRLSQGLQVQRPGKPVSVGRVVRVQLAPLQHYSLEGIQAADWTWCAANHDAVLLGRG